jgi:hypothetical protein
MHEKPFGLTSQLAVSTAGGADRSKRMSPCAVPNTGRRSPSYSNTETRALART